MKEKQFVRICPQCKKEVFHTFKHAAKEADKLKKICRKCKDKIKFIDFWIQKYGLCGAKNKYEEWKRNKNKFQKGNLNPNQLQHVKELKSKRSKLMWQEVLYRNKMSSLMKDNKNFQGRIHSENTKRKQRLSAINQLKLKCRKDFHPNYNKRACEIFNEIMKSQSIYIQHAENGGEYYIQELGYWLDGYDKINNTVYEFDENRKFSNGLLNSKHIERQKEIEKFLNCKFIRLSEND